MLDPATALARIRIDVRQSIDSTTVIYAGQAEDLIALGCVNADMLMAGTRGRMRLTADGHRFWRQYCKRSGQYKVGFLFLPYAVAEAMPGVPRTWRGVVGPLLELTSEQRRAFEAEGGLYRERGAA